MKIDNKIKNKIINLYKSGFTQMEIKQELGICRKTISDVIVKNGISKYKGRRWNKYTPSEETINKIKLLCRLGYRKQQISHQIGISDVTMSKIMADYGVAFRRSPSFLRKYPLDENFIDNIDSEIKAHFLGFFFADGYNNGNSLAVISIAEVDKEYLQKINNIIQPTKPLKIRKKFLAGKRHQDQCRMEINSKHFSETLSYYGAIKNKSLILKFPEKQRIPQNLINHFIRGYFDGDGGISRYESRHFRKDKVYIYEKYSIGICGTKDFLTQVKFYLDKHNIISRIKKNGKKIYSLEINAIESIHNFFNFIYDDANIFLLRKYNKMLEFKTFYKNRGAA